MMGGEKALAFGPTMRRMLSFMGQFKGRLLLVLLFAVASTAFSIVGPKVLSEATTVLFDGAVASAAGTGSIDFDAIAASFWRRWPCTCCRRRARGCSPGS